MAKGSSTPAGQQKPLLPASESANEDAPSHVSMPETPSRSALLEHASQFLEDDVIKHAPMERKTEFLQEKGLTKEEIDQLLARTSGDGEHAQSATTDGTSDLKTVHDSTTTAHDTDTTAASQSTEAPTFTATAPNPRQDVPPIITYPEFLLRSRKPPPLITAQQLSYAVYGASVLALTTYGAGKYVVEPMLRTLTSSRHDLFTTTLPLLKKLNQKLEANVSSIPPLPSKRPTSAQYKDDADTDDASSIASDPTELFHRDIATQTSKSLPDSPLALPSSQPPSTSPIISSAERSAQLNASHITRLNNISATLSFLDTTEQSFVQADTTKVPYATMLQALTDQTRVQVADLQNYLDSVKYGRAATTFHPADVFSENNKKNNPPVNGNGNSDNPPFIPDHDDAISDMKKEIRSLKGAVLSSRNFPSARVELDKLADVE